MAGAVMVAPVIVLWADAMQEPREWPNEAETLAIVAHRLFGLNVPVTWQPSTEAIIDPGESGRVKNEMRPPMAPLP